MINNDGWNEKVFNEMLDLTKMGGFLIFATKLDIVDVDQYADIINKLCDEHHMNFLTEHTFYRYDKLGDNGGKFSNRRVKVIAFQKTDNATWAREQELLKEKLENEEREAEEREILRQQKLKAKFGGKTQKQIAEEKEALELEEAEKAAAEKARIEEEAAAEKAAKKKI